jgi:hypothetical protein
MFYFTYRELIAINIQRLYRGWKVRQSLLFDRWIEMNKAATVLQRSFRRFKLRLETKMIIDIYLSRKKLNKVIINESNHNIEKIFNNQSTTEENFAFWRSVIELRKSYPKYSTDLLIKALTESKGKVLDAQTLLGNPVFGVRNDEDLSMKHRLRFLPESSVIDHKELFQSTLTENQKNQFSKREVFQREVLKILLQSYYSNRHHKIRAKNKLNY